MRLVFFTICAKNYLPIAQTFLSSVQPLYPAADFLLVLCDKAEPPAPPIDGVTILTLDMLGIEQLADMITRYDVTELSTAIKPFVFDKLFAQGVDAAIYCDPDLYFLSRLQEIETALTDGFDAIVTPHITAPIDDDRQPSDQHLLRVGAYNLGFLALRNAEPSRRFVQWWARRLERGAIVELEAGLFTDQKWCDLLPSFIEKTLILRHAGYNLAYWNLMHRHVDHSDQGWTANGLPVRFAHFSGVLFDEPEAFSRYQNRYDQSTLGKFGPLYSAYLDAVRANRKRFEPIAAYGLDRTADGLCIPPLLRKMYRQMPVANSGQSVEQRVAGTIAYANSPAPELPNVRKAPITRIMFHVWNSRLDLRLTFPLTTPRERRSYGFWFLTAAERELGLDARFTRPILGALSPNTSSADPIRDVNVQDLGTARVGGIMRFLSSWRALARILPVPWRHKLRSKFAEMALADSGRTRDPATEAAPLGKGAGPDNS